MPTVAPPKVTPEVASSASALCTSTVAAVTDRPASRSMATGSVPVLMTTTRNDVSEGCTTWTRSEAAPPTTATSGSGPAPVVAASSNP